MTQPVSADRLIKELLDCFDDVQNLVRLAHGAELALYHQFDDDEDRFAVLEVVIVIREKCEAIKKKIAAANDADVMAFVAKERSVAR
jgi:hypothetical protein